MKNIKFQSDIFLEKSYRDTWSDYQYSLSSARAVVWDWIVVTASNERQAETYRLQIDERLKNKSLPERTKYAVISDPDGRRIGSGGATLNLLRYVYENSDVSLKNPFDSKILVIHSGGDSKRVPQYSACGKLFSPVPKLLLDGRRSTLFDELIISTAGMPPRMSNGMLVMSGDALLLFNSLQVDLRLNRDAVALSMKESIEIGANHGVFLCGRDRYVDNFLHKQTADILRKMGAADEDDCVDLDTGAVWLKSSVLNDLLSLISDNGNINDEKFGTFVNEDVRLSFYGDFIYPLAGSSTYDKYINSDGEVPLSGALIECRSQIWNILRKYKMSIIRMSPAKFVHFGTTLELHQLMTDITAQYGFLNWKKNILTNAAAEEYAVNNSYISTNACIGDNCYIEDCYIGENVNVGQNAVLSGISLRNIDIPSDVVMHCLKLQNGGYTVRIYGIKDNPKLPLENNFLCSESGRLIDGVKPDRDRTLWNSEIYPVCDTAEKAAEQSLIIYKISSGTASGSEVDKWKKADKISLEQSFQIADTHSIFLWRKNLENIIRAEQFIQALTNRTDIKEAACILGEGNGLFERLELLLDMAGSCNYSIKMRIYLALSYIMRVKNINAVRGLDYQRFEDMCYDVLNHEINSAMQKTTLSAKKIPKFEFKKDEVVVELPVRVNLGGGWSDTPPHSLENGGTVLNAAILLNGKPPTRVVVKRLTEKIICLESIDLGYKQKFTAIEQILNCSDLNDAFVIVKTALVITKIISLNDKSLDEVLEKLGGGIYVSISANVPKGSGLGTSSILAGGCIRAISEIFGIDYDMDTIYSQVLCLEQLMGTGGGWQDQVGGLVNGIKMIKSMPGTVQKLDVKYVNMTEKSMNELEERYALVYSGQQRLAKNILREVMNKYILSDSRTLEILYEIQRISVLMEFELEKGNITAFAELLNRHLELSKQLDKGSSNTCIDQIFDVCDDLIDGKCICGAGGGGFLQMILKKGVTKDDLQRRLNNVFRNSGVEVWDCDFV